MSHSRDTSDTSPQLSQVCDSVSFTHIFSFSFWVTFFSPWCAFVSCVSQNSHVFSIASISCPSPGLLLSLPLTILSLPTKFAFKKNTAVEHISSQNDCRERMSKRWRRRKGRVSHIQYCHRVSLFVTSFFIFIIRSIKYRLHSFPYPLFLRPTSQIKSKTPLSTSLQIIEEFVAA